MRAISFTAADDGFLRAIGAGAEPVSVSSEEAEFDRQIVAGLEAHTAIACALWREEIGISARWRRIAFASFTVNVVLACLAGALFLWGLR